MAIDAKYGRVTVEKVRRVPIGEDEPVFLFRAQDELLPDVLEHYHALCKQAGSPEEHLDGIYEAMDRIESWQASNPARVPGT